MRQLTGSILAKKSLLITMPNSLRFCIKRVARLKKRTPALLITNIFLQYASKTRLTPRVEHPPSYYQKIFTKYFIGLYPYYLVNRAAVAKKPKNCWVGTNRLFLENMRQLARARAMSVNEFIVQVLSETMAEELNNNLMLYQTII
jgi:hypothetical protein